ncbi:MAG: MFS transporter [Candidatus Cloacimonetes bacterium]|nr:MFS transporter [Candidatus Cloacimonadota bacterium]
MKIYLFKFFGSLHFIAGVLIPFFTDWGGITFTQIMILQSWFMLWIFLLEIPTGTVADYLGRKHSLILACVVNIIGALVYASKPNFYVFLAGEFLWAMAMALMSGADEALIYDTLKKIGDTKKSKKVFGRVQSFALAGIMVGAPVGSIIAAKLGLRATMLLIIIPFTIAFTIALTFKEPKISHEIKSKNYITILKEGVKFFYKNKVLKILALDFIFIGSIAYFMIWLYQPMLKHSGINIIYFGIVHSAFVASQILIMNNYERLEKIFGSKKGLIFFSSVITGIMFIISGLTKCIPIVLLVIILGGGFGLSRRPLFVSYMNKYIPSEKRATVLSTISMLRRLGLLVINPFVGLLVDWSLNYTLIILGIAAVLFSFISKVEEGHLID